MIDCFFVFMRDRRIFFKDLDGVAGDWFGRAAQILDLSEDQKRDRIDNDCELKPEEKAILYSQPEKFWTELDVFPWTNDLIELTGRYGTNAFLSSGGNVYDRTKQVAQAHYGKTIWAPKYFKDIPIILGDEKYLLASNRSFLIDDTEEQVNNFKEWGGSGFLWPNSYKILSGEIDICDVMSDLEIQIQEFVRV